jgi:predicted O-methyltransferase YrrM
VLDVPGTSSRKRPFEGVGYPATVAKVLRLPAFSSRLVTINPHHRLIRFGGSIGRHGFPATLIACRAKGLGAAQKLKEFAGLARLVGKQPPRVVVEIGTLHGGTLWTWCQLATDEATIVGIDLPGGPFGGGLTDADRLRVGGYPRRSQTIHLIEADSHAPETKQRLLGLLAGQPVDLLFIDGDHGYAGVKQDFAMYAPLVRPGGLIAFHDVLLHEDSDTDVARLWDEIKDGFEYYGFLDPADVRARGQWGGIGVLVQPLEPETPRNSV